MRDSSSICLLFACSFSFIYCLEENLNIISVIAAEVSKTNNELYQIPSPRYSCAELPAAPIKNNVIRRAMLIDDRIRLLIK